jgi:Delta7-sterol 5-desaturase
VIAFALGLDPTIAALGPLALIWSAAFASHFIRCVLASGLTELAVARVPALRARRLRAVEPDDAQRRREFRFTLHTGAIFGLQFLMLIGASLAGFTQLYFDPKRFGAAYLVWSFLFALVIHDTYFYWTHRWMHRRSVFKTVHLDHHRSHHPTAWTAFSFHPLESIVQGAIHLLLPMVIPIHVSVLGIFILWTNVYGALLHCGCDVFFTHGAGTSSWRTFCLNGAVEHEAHHNGCDGNFALYFSFWDRLMGTRVVADRPGSFTPAFDQQEGASR